MAYHNMMKDDRDSIANDAIATGNRSASAALWWATFFVAILAIPTLVCIIARVVPLRGAGQLVAFMLGCWLCTYLGMLLMDGPKWKGGTKGAPRQTFHPNDLQ